MVTYTMLWSPIGYMEDAKNHDCRGARGTEMCLLVSNKEHRGAGSILRRGGPSLEEHHVPVKATDGEICPPLFQLLVYLLDAIFLNHKTKNLFYVFKFLLLESNLYEFLLQQGCHSGEER